MPNFYDGPGTECNSLNAARENDGDDVLEKVAVDLADASIARAIAEDIVDPILEEAINVVIMRDELSRRPAEECAWPGLAEPIHPDKDSAGCPSESAEKTGEMLVGDTRGDLMEELNSIISSFKLLSVSCEQPRLEDEMKRAISAISSDFQWKFSADDIPATREGQGDVEIVDPVESGGDITAGERNFNYDVNHEEETSHVIVDVLHRMIVELEDDPQEETSPASSENNNATTIHLKLDDKKEYHTYKIQSAPNAELSQPIITELPSTASVQLQIGATANLILDKTEKDQSYNILANDDGVTYNTTEAPKVTGNVPLELWQIKSMDLLAMALAVEPEQGYKLSESVTTANTDVFQRSQTAPASSDVNDDATSETQSECKCEAECQLNVDEPLDDFHKIGIQFPDTEMGTSGVTNVCDIKPHFIYTIDGEIECTGSIIEEWEDRNEQEVQIIDPDYERSDEEGILRLQPAPRRLEMHSWCCEGTSSQSAKLPSVNSLGREFNQDTQIMQLLQGVAETLTTSHEQVRSHHADGHEVYDYLQSHPATITSVSTPSNSLVDTSQIDIPPLPIIPEDDKYNEFADVDPLFRVMTVSDTPDNTVLVDCIPHSQHHSRELVSVNYADDTPCLSTNMVTLTINQSSSAECNSCVSKLTSRERLPSSVHCDVSHNMKRESAGDISHTPRTLTTNSTTLVKEPSHVLTSESGLTTSYLAECIDNDESPRVIASSIDTAHSVQNIEYSGDTYPCKTMTSEHTGNLILSEYLEAVTEKAAYMLGNTDSVHDDSINIFPQTITLTVEPESGLILPEQDTSCASCGGDVVRSVSGVENIEDDISSVQEVVKKSEVDDVKHYLDTIHSESYTCRESAIHSQPSLVANSTEPCDQILIINYDQSIARESTLFLQSISPFVQITTEPCDQMIIPNYGSIYEGEYVLQLNSHSTTTTAERQQVYKSLGAISCHPTTPIVVNNTGDRSMKFDGDQSESQVKIYSLKMESGNRTIRPNTVQHPDTSIYQESRVQTGTDGQNNTGSNTDQRSEQEQQYSQGSDPTRGNSPYPPGATNLDAPGNVNTCNNDDRSSDDENQDYHDEEDDSCDQDEAYHLDDHEPDEADEPSATEPSVQKESINSTETTGNDFQESADPVDMEEVCYAPTPQDTHQISTHAGFNNHESRSSLEAANFDNISYENESCDYYDGSYPDENSHQTDLQDDLEESANSCHEYSEYITQEVLDVMDSIEDACIPDISSPDKSLSDYEDIYRDEDSHIDDVCVSRTSQIRIPKNYNTKTPISDRNMSDGHAESQVDTVINDNQTCARDHTSGTANTEPDTGEQLYETFGQTIGQHKPDNETAGVSDMEYVGPTQSSVEGRLDSPGEEHRRDQNERENDYVYSVSVKPPELIESGENRNDLDSINDRSLQEALSNNTSYELSPNRFVRTDSDGDTFTRRALCFIDIHPALRNDSDASGLYDLYDDKSYQFFEFPATSTSSERVENEDTPISLQLLSVSQDGGETSETNAPCVYTSGIQPRESSQDQSNAIQAEETIKCSAEHLAVPRNEDGVAHTSGVISTLKQDEASSDSEPIEDSNQFYSNTAKHTGEISPSVFENFEDETMTSPEAMSSLVKDMCAKARLLESQNPCEEESISNLQTSSDDNVTIKRRPSDENLKRSYWSSVGLIVEQRRDVLSLEAKDFKQELAQYDLNHLDLQREESSVSIGDQPYIDSIACGHCSDKKIPSLRRFNETDEKLDECAGGTANDQEVIDPLIYSKEVDEAKAELPSSSVNEESEDHWNDTTEDDTSTKNGGNVNRKKKKKSKGWKLGIRMRKFITSKLGLSRPSSPLIAAPGPEVAKE